MCKLLQQYGPLFGRILLSTIFIIAGINKISGFSSTLEYMTSKGLPLVELLLILTIIVELAGGLMILLGFYARHAATAIFFLLLPITFFFHPFWSFEGQEAIHHYHSFFKNLAIMGGMLYIMSYGSGPLSLKQEQHCKSS